MFGRGLPAAVEGLVRIMTLPGVFRPRSDSWLLADVLCAQTLAPGASVLDLCTGSGVVAVSAAVRRGARASAVDVSRRAALTAQINGRLNGVSVRARAGDLFAPFREESFDAIVSNPPYLPAEADPELPERGPSRAWEGGLDGRVVLDRIVAEAPARLRPGGFVLLVHSEVCSTRATLDGLAAGGLDAEVVTRHRGPLGPLLGARAPQLVARGLLAPGQREEDVVVVRGRAPAVPGGGGGARRPARAAAEGGPAG